MTIKLFLNIIILTIIGYMVGAFLGNSFNTKNWNEESKIYLVMIYLIILGVMVLKPH